MHVNYYTKYGCSLCDEGLAILRKFSEIKVNIVDVEDDTEKYHSYLLRIPVISYDDGKKELSWPFGENDVQKLISS
jgi:hypothetical protein